MNLKIHILSKNEFYDLVLECLLKDKGDLSPKETFEYLLEYGFTKLDFENLNKSIAGMGIYLPTVAVEICIGSEFIWVVYGSSAMLVSRRIMFNNNK